MEIHVEGNQPIGNKKWRKLVYDIDMSHDR